MSLVSDLLPDLDAIRSSAPTDIGLRGVTLTVRTTRILSNSLLDSLPTEATDKAIVSSTGDRYKVREVSTKEMVASGGLYQAGAIKVGPITPPFPGSSFTRDDLLPASLQGQEVYYGVTDQAGATQWCVLADADALHDLHWYLTLNPTGTQPAAPISP